VGLVQKLCRRNGTINLTEGGGQQDLTGEGTGGGVKKNDEGYSYIAVGKQQKKNEGRNLPTLTEKRLNRGGMGKHQVGRD